MKKTELMNMIDEKDYSKKKIFQEIDPLILENQSVQKLIKDLKGSIYCYDLMVSYSRSNKLVAFIITPLDQELNETGEGILVWFDEDYKLVTRNINMEEIGDLEPIITKTYMV